MTHDLPVPVELTETELDAVAAGLAAGVVAVNIGPTNVDVDIRNVNVAVQALNNASAIRQA
jgi:hypothetical protein